MMRHCTQTDKDHSTVKTQPEK